VTESDPRQGPELPEDARLSSLDERLRRAQQAEALRQGAQRPDSNTRLWQRAFAEMIGAPFGGGLLGWVLDHWLRTSPWFLLALLFIGFGVGIRNSIRLFQAPPGHGSGGQSS
jgi:ATP synthase protein I